MSLHRTHRRRADRIEAKEKKASNRIVKDAERARRDARMVQKLKSGGLPYAPTVMSWLSRKLDKKSTAITPADVQALVR